jgi:hypothetical protein
MTIEQKNKMSMLGVIRSKRGALESDFEALDITNSGKVTRSQWAEVMQRVTRIRVRWLPMIDTVVPSSCLLVRNTVDYRLFLASAFSIESSKAADGEGNAGLSSMEIMYQSYGPRKKLEAIFRFFDTDNNGVRVQFQILSFFIYVYTFLVILFDLILISFLFFV